MLEDHTIRNYLDYIASAIIFEIYLHCYCDITDNLSQIIHILEYFQYYSRYVQNLEIFSIDVYSMHNVQVLQTVAIDV